MDTFDLTVVCFSVLKYNISRTCNCGINHRFACYTELPIISSICQAVLY